MDNHFEFFDSSLTPDEIWIFLISIGTNIAVFMDDLE